MVTMNNTPYKSVGGIIRGTELNSLNKHVLHVLLH